MYISYPLTLIFRIMSVEQPVLSLVSLPSLHLAFSVCITVNLKLMFVIPYWQYVTITPKRLQCCPLQVGLHNISQRSINLNYVFPHYFLGLEDKGSLVRWSPQLMTQGFPLLGTDPMQVCHGSVLLQWQLKSYDVVWRGRDNLVQQWNTVRQQAMLALRVREKLQTKKEVSYPMHTAHQAWYFVHVACLPRVVHASSPVWFLSLSQPSSLLL